MVTILNFLRNCICKLCFTLFKVAHRPTFIVKKMSGSQNSKICPNWSDLTQCTELQASASITIWPISLKTVIAITNSSGQDMIQIFFHLVEQCCYELDRISVWSGSASMVLDAEPDMSNSMMPDLVKIRAM